MMKKLILLLLSLSSLAQLYGQDFAAVRGIAQRRAPWLAPHLVFERIASASGARDTFALEQMGHRLKISASSVSAASKALGWYLKYHCRQSMSHLGDNLHRPKSLPRLEQSVCLSSPYVHRYALNYCTISYSMAHYDWQDWERELDWMALNGVNLLLAPVGMEAVWRNMLRSLGYSPREIQDFIAHPTFGAWWLMGNLEGWGGPISDALIDRQLELQRKILRRMRALGIEPVMQGFYGMIPTSFKEKMPLRAIPQGKWAGGFQRPDFLDPTDPNFAPLAELYYREMKALYGGEFKYFGADPFHEGGTSGGVEVSLAASIIQREMLRAYPSSTWVLQGWGGNPSKALLSGLDKRHALVLELFGENTSHWEQRKGYEGTPFVWATVSNFGEKTGLYGKLQRFADELYRASTSPYAPLLRGVGIIPEGIHNNPVVYDWVLELAWGDGHRSAREWIGDYLHARYGKLEDEMLRAWEIFLETIYSSPQIGQEGPSESLFCARPAVDLPSVSTWGTHQRHYDVELFERGVRLFLSLEGRYRGSETYQTDKIDLLRQLLSNRGKQAYECMMTSLRGRNVEAFERESAHFLHLIELQDELLSLSPYFRLDHWLAPHARLGQSRDDRAQALRNAKRQYTIWGPDDNPSTNLHEYAHKEWSGLLSGLYAQRWRLFVEEQLARLRGLASKSPDYFALELEWIEREDPPTRRPISTRRYREIISELLPH